MSVGGAPAAGLRPARFKFHVSSFRFPGVWEAPQRAEYRSRSQSGRYTVIPKERGCQGFSWNLDRGTGWSKTSPPLHQLPHDFFQGFGGRPGLVFGKARQGRIGHLQ